MLKRTDRHRPSVIIPSDYEFVSFHSHRDEDVVAATMEQQAFRQHMQATGGKFSSHEHGGTCHVCGNVHAITVARFYHSLSNTYVEVGETCAHKLDGGEALDFRSFRERVKRGTAVKAGKAKAQKFLTENGLAAAWDVYTAESGDTFAETTVCDIVNKLVRYGSVSDKQVAFLGKLVKQIADAPAVEAARAAEAEAADPVPTGRIAVTGEVLTVKGQDTSFGYVTKMLVRAEGGYKLWGTVPRSILDDITVGNTVAFIATLKPSPDDAKFGFYSRPSKAALA